MLLEQDFKSVIEIGDSSELCEEDFRRRIIEEKGDLWNEEDSFNFS